MPATKLRTVRIRFDTTVSEMEKLASSAQQWATLSFPKGIPKFSTHHCETVTGLAFLRSFIALELFLEQSFILYLLGLRTPKGPKPKRLVEPTNRRLATLVLVGEKSYIDWYKWDQLKDRSRKYFKDGEPYAGALIGRKSLFEEMVTVRNALAHSSGHSQERFKRLVRSKLSGAYPPRLTVGGFLAMTIPGSSPPESFLDHYIESVSMVADLIIPI
jgi:hypothetical protein